LESLKKLNKLKIEVENWQNLVLMDCIFDLGSTLQELTFRNENEVGTITGNNTISAPPFTRLRAACPNLTYLGISLDTYSIEVFLPHYLIVLEHPLHLQPFQMLKGGTNVRQLEQALNLIGSEIGDEYSVEVTVPQMSQQLRNIIPSDKSVSFGSVD
jgi:hypothetical protein